MDIVLLGKAVVMGIVEGLTEFLPISSTGHLILAGSLLGFTDETAKVFDIAIQTGAIFAVILVYWQRVRETVLGLGSDRRAQRFAGHVLDRLPARRRARRAVRQGDQGPPVHAAGGGLDLHPRRLRDPLGRTAPAECGARAHGRRHDAMDALKVGLVQCLALIPGTSRSGATIIGGMLFGLSRKAATDFSFFLAIPTLIGAGVYSLYKERALLSATDCRCSPSAWCSRSSALAVRALAAALHRPRTTSCRSPGTASPSAWWCSRHRRAAPSCGPSEENHPRSAFGASPQGGAASGPAKPDPRRPLDVSVHASRDVRSAMKH